jgi:hypothetical protein
MNRLPAFLAAFTVSVYSGLSAELTPIDLSPHVGKSQFDFVEFPWAVPVGEHVMNGVPWKASIRK